MWKRRSRKFAAGLVATSSPPEELGTKARSGRNARIWALGIAGTLLGVPLLVSQGPVLGDNTATPQTVSSPVVALSLNGWAPGPFCERTIGDYKATARRTKDNANLGPIKVEASGSGITFPGGKATVQVATGSALTDLPAFAIQMNIRFEKFAGSDSRYTLFQGYDLPVTLSLERVDDQAPGDAGNTAQVVAYVPTSSGNYRLASPTLPPSLLKAGDGVDVGLLVTGKGKSTDQEALLLLGGAVVDRLSLARIERSASVLGGTGTKGPLGGGQGGGNGGTGGGTGGGATPTPTPGTTGQDLCATSGGELSPTLPYFLLGGGNEIAGVSTVSQGFKGKLTGLKIWNGIPSGWKDKLETPRENGMGEIESLWFSLEATAKDALRCQTPNAPLDWAGVVKGGQGDGPQSRAFLCGKPTAQGGLYWSQETGANAVWGDHYKAYKDYSKQLGFPTKDNTAFAKGELIKTKAGKLLPVFGSIYTTWKAEKSLGEPTENPERLLSKPEGSQTALTSGAGKPSLAGPSTSSSGSGKPAPASSTAAPTAPKATTTATTSTPKSTGVATAPTSAKTAPSPTGKPSTPPTSPSPGKPGQGGSSTNAGLRAAHDKRATGDGWRQTFEKGMIVSPLLGEPIVLSGPIWEKYRDLGGVKELGIPAGPVQTVYKDSEIRKLVAARMTAAKRDVSSTSDRGASSPKDSKPGATVGKPGVTPAPGSSSVPGPTGVPANDGSGQLLALVKAGTPNGKIYWSEATGAHYVKGGFQAKYQLLGGPSSTGEDSLGFPKTDWKDGQRLEFQGGMMFPAKDTPLGVPGMPLVVRGKILEEYLRQSAEKGTFGLPTSDEQIDADKRVAVSWFDNGLIYYKFSAGKTFAVRMHPEVSKIYRRSGGPAGFLLDCPEAPDPYEGGKKATAIVNCAGGYIKLVAGKGGDSAVDSALGKKYRDAVIAFWEREGGKDGKWGPLEGEMEPGRYMGLWFKNGYIAYDIVKDTVQGVTVHPDAKFAYKREGGTGGWLMECDRDDLQDPYKEYGTFGAISCIGGKLLVEKSPLVGMPKVARGIRSIEVRARRVVIPCLDDNNHALPTEHWPQDPLLEYHFGQCFDDNGGESCLGFVYAGGEFREHEGEDQTNFCFNVDHEIRLYDIGSSFLAGIDLWDYDSSSGDDFLGDGRIDLNISNWWGLRLPGLPQTKECGEDEEIDDDEKGVKSRFPVHKVTLDGGECDSEFFFQVIPHRPPRPKLK